MVLGELGGGLCMKLCLVGVECLGFKRWMCLLGGLFLWCSLSMSKELDNGIGLEENSELEKLGKPHLSQIHETLLLTNPA